ncbi:hypothetical protein [Amycolatopsis pigmentata]|uniref:Uncharacterized protein n=1 Tax=Amycolatopsis pigmentata TaxID=450801 RepID=A0ABW5G2T1_9PSEU
MASNKDRAAKVRHSGRGLCTTCYVRAKRRDELIDYERVSRPAVEVFEDTRRLAGECLTHAQIATRMGMTLAAYERAIYRHKAKERAA